MCIVMMTIIVVGVMNHKYFYRKMYYVIIKFIYKSLNEKCMYYQHAKFASLIFNISDCFTINIR